MSGGFLRAEIDRKCFDGEGAVIFVKKQGKKIRVEPATRRGAILKHPQATPLNSQDSIFARIRVLSRVFAIEKSILSALTFSPQPLLRVLRDLNGYKMGPEAPFHLGAAEPDETEGMNYQ